VTRPQVLDDLARKMMELEPARVRRGSGPPGLFPPALPRLFYKRPVPEEFRCSVDPFAAAWVALSDEERRQWRADPERALSECTTPEGPPCKTPLPDST